MQPLQWVALGYLLVLLDLPVAGWDVLPDPVGWALVVAALVAVPRWRTAVGVPAVAAPALALVVALVLYVPGLVAIGDPALAWAVSLPQVAAAALLAFAMSEATPGRRGSWRLAGWLQVAVGVIPVAVLGGGTAGAGLVGLAAFVAVAASLYLVWLLLSAPAADEPVGQPA
ncbi:hypothetical protein [Nocardioides marmoraquaticus]